MQNKTISHITGNEQATHSMVAVNSMATMVLKLKDEFLGDSTDPDGDLNQLYLDSIETLRTLTVDDFFKKNESRDPALVEEISEELPLVISHIIRITEEPLNTAFDIVTLYRDGKDETIELPLKWVLPILLRAYQNDNAFAHQYSGDVVEQLEQAQSDRPLRMFSFFRCLQRTKQGLCHTGVRNELVGLLNGTYKGIHILEDARATIEYFLKDALQNRINDEIPRVNPKTNEANAFQRAILMWMNESNPTELWTIVDKQQQIQDQLIQIFMEHGSDPNHIRIKDDNDQLIPLSEFIPNLMNRLLFQRDIQKQPLLAFADDVLKANAQVSDQEVRNSALLTMQDWINNQWDLFSKNDAPLLAGFYAVYNAHLHLQNYRTLLLSSQAITEQELQDYHDAIEVYFKSNLPSSLNTELKDKIDTLEKLVNTTKKLTFQEPIENFFTRWFEAKLAEDRKTISRLYQFLLDTKVQQKIHLSDDILQQWSQKITKEHDQQFRDITPYEINRIFLDAIITSPDRWTTLFAETFRTTLAFIKDLDTNTAIGQALKTSSYPPKLIRQLDYLQQEYNYLQTEQQTNKPNRPDDMIVLPNQIKTPDEWFRISSHLDPTQRLTYYKNNYRIAILLGDESLCHAEFSKVLASIPREEQARFLKMFGRKIINSLDDFQPTITYIMPEERAAVYIGLKDHLLNMIQTADDFGKLLKYFDAEQCATIYSDLNDHLSQLLKTAEDFGHVLKHLNSSQSDFVYTELKNRFRELFKKTDHLRDLLKHLSMRQAIDVCQALKDELLKMNSGNFNALLQDCNEDQRTAIYLALKDGLLDMIKIEYPSTLYDVLEYLNMKQCKEVWTSLQDQLPKFIGTQEDLIDFLNSYGNRRRNTHKTEPFTNICGGLKWYLLTIIKTAEDFRNALLKLKPEQRVAVYKMLNKDLPNMIDTPDDLYALLTDLSAEQCTLICEESKSYLLNMVNKNRVDLLKCFYRLHNVEKIAAVCTTLKDLLLEEIKTPGDFGRFLQFLSVKKSTVICTILKDHLLNIVETVDDFRDVLKPLNAEQCTIVCTELKDRLPNIIKKSADFCHKVLNIFLGTEKSLAICTAFKNQLIYIVQTSDYEQYKSQLFFALSCCMQDKQPHQSVYWYENECKRKEQLLAEVTLFFERAESLKQMMQIITKYAAVEKANIFLDALVSNDASKIKTQLNELFQTTHQHHFFPADLSQQKEECMNAIQHVDAYWMDRIDNALDPNEPNGAFQRFFQSSNSSSNPNP